MEESGQTSISVLRTEKANSQWQHSTAQHSTDDERIAKTQEHRSRKETKKQQIIEVDLSTTLQ
jgi:hypothetical protein